jgi:hypothetical protein
MTAALAIGPGGGLDALPAGAALLWVPITILALLAVWTLAGSSEVPLHRLERLLRIVLRASQWHRDTKKATICLSNSSTNTVDGALTTPAHGAHRRHPAWSGLPCASGITHPARLRVTLLAQRYSVPSPAV